MSDTEPLFLLPGLLCDEFVFAGQVHALANHARIRVATFLGLNSIQAMAESVLAVAPDRFALAGFSMGGRVALQIVRQAPERVTRLALLDTGAEACQTGEVEKRLELVVLAHEEGMAAVAARWLPPMLHPARISDPAIVAPLTDMVCRASPDQFEAQIRALVGRPDAKPVLTTIACPTLILCGRQDGFSPLGQHLAMAETIAGAKLEVIEDAGHFAPVEAPDPVAQALRRWLTQ